MRVQNKLPLFSDTELNLQYYYFQGPKTARKCASPIYNGYAAELSKCIEVVIVNKTIPNAVRDLRITPVPHPEIPHCVRDDAHCLRCRPELAPGNAPVDSSRRIAHLIARQMEEKLISEGTNLENIAKQFQISSRQLRLKQNSRYNAFVI